MGVSGFYVFAFFFGLACSHPAWYDDFSASTPNIIIMLMDDVRLKISIFNQVFITCQNVGYQEVQKRI